MILLLYLAIFLFFVLSIWILVTLSNHKPVLLWIYIPLNIFVAASTIFVYDSILGNPTRRTLPEKFDLIAFNIDEPKAIYLWIKIRDRRSPIYHERPYSKEEHKQLEEMREMVEKGKVRGEKQDGVKKTNSKEDSNNDLIRYYDFTKELKFPDKNE